MAIGDFSVSMSGNNTAQNIQPLAGVVLMMTAFASDNGTNLMPQTTDGANLSGYRVNGNGAQLYDTKILATNALYFHIPAGGAGNYTTVCYMEVA